MITKEILYGWWFPWTPKYGSPGMISLGFGYFRISIFWDYPCYYRNVYQTGFCINWKPNLECKEGEYAYFHSKDLILEEFSRQEKYLSRIQKEIE